MKAWLPNDFLEMSAQSSYIYEGIFPRRFQYGGPKTIFKKIHKFKGA
jgi:hypothetical protein